MGGGELARARDQRPGVIDQWPGALAQGSRSRRHIPGSHGDSSPGLGGLDGRPAGPWVQVAHPCMEPGRPPTEVVALHPETAEAPVDLGQPYVEVDASYHEPARPYADLAQPHVEAIGPSMTPPAP